LGWLIDAAKMHFAKVPHPRVADFMPRFDARSRPIYCAAAVLILICAVTSWANGFVIPDPGFIYDIAILVSFFIFEATMLRRAGWHRTANALETVILTLLAGFLTSLTLVPLTGISASLRDAVLIRWDLFFGYHWLETYYAVAAYPSAMKALTLAYRSFFPQSAGILILLCCCNRENRAWQVAAAGAISLFMTALLYPFFPADAAYNHFGIPYPRPDHFAETIHQIKAGRRLILPRDIGGLVTFPSFHVSAAVLVPWGGWTLRFIRWPLVIVNIIVAASAIFIGAHYFVDVLGGAAIAAVAIWLSVKLVPSTVPLASTAS
jgi:membrane-associated phospholipid phosphatase